MVDYSFSVDWSFRVSPAIEDGICGDMNRFYQSIIIFLWRSIYNRFVLISNRKVYNSLTLTLSMPEKISQRRCYDLLQTYLTRFELTLDELSDRCGVEARLQGPWMKLLEHGPTYVQINEITWALGQALMEKHQRGIIKKRRMKSEKEFRLDLILNDLRSAAGYAYTDEPIFHRLEYETGLAECGGPPALLKVGYSREQTWLHRSQGAFDSEYGQLTRNLIHFLGAEVGWVLTNDIFAALESGEIDIAAPISIQPQWNIAFSNSVRTSSASDGEPYKCPLAFAFHHRERKFHYIIDDSIQLLEEQRRYGNLKN